MPLNHGLIDSIDVSLAGLPAPLEGFRIAHLTDLHIRRNRARHDRIVRQLARLRIDMVVMTGDYMMDPGYEAAATQFFTDLCTRVRPAHGIFAVGGNHDSRELCEQTSHLNVHWLNNSARAVDGVPLEVVGFEHTATREPDSIAALLNMADARNTKDSADAAKVPAAPDRVVKDTRAISSSASEYESGGAARDRQTSVAAPAKVRPPRTMRLLLSHCANMLPAASDMGVDLMFAGHTHGGQLRIPPGWPFFNSSDLPLRLTSGILRHRDTICLVSRGLGEAGLPLRFCCPPHLPIYTLHEGPTPGQFTDEIENVRPW